jgi:RND family efflux transporter MFP subunit
VTGYGSVEFEPGRAQTLVVEVESQVVGVAVAAGAAVRRGEVLVRLRPSAPTRLDVARATREAAVAIAEKIRQARLRGEGLATEAEAATAAAAADTASQLRDSLIERTGGGHEYTLTAPRDGILDTLNAQPGDLIAAGAGVARIGDSRAMQARIGLEPRDVLAVKAGAVAHVSVLGGDSDRIEGRVTAVERRVDKDSGLTAALVSLPATAEAVPGVQVSGTIVVSTRLQALVIPRAAVLYDGTDTSVFVVEAGHAHRRTVRTGVVDEDGAEVLDGLKRGDSVVTVGNHELEDGMAVRPATPAAPAAAATGAAGESAADKDPK